LASDDGDRVYAENQVHSAERQLDLLAIFHYVLGGILALMSFFPLLYMSFIWHLLHNPEVMRSQSPPPAILGTILLAAGIAIAAMGWAWAGLIMLAGRFLQKRRNRIYCLVVGAMACMFQPFGTILGVFTIVILLRPDVEALFRMQSQMQPPPLPPHV
jgi:hypothetical protein